MIVIDTSVVIDFLRRGQKEKTLLYLLAGQQLFVSIITHAELYAGKSVWEKQKAKNELDILFAGLEIVPLTKNISTEAGRIRAKYGINLIDSIIAATALSKKAPLATFNTRHFSKIKGLDIIPKESNPHRPRIRKWEVS